MDFLEARQLEARLPELEIESVRQDLVRASGRGHEAATGTGAALHHLLEHDLRIGRRPVTALYGRRVDANALDACRRRHFASAPLPFSQSQFCSKCSSSPGHVMTE